MQTSTSFSPAGGIVIRSLERQRRRPSWAGLGLTAALLVSCALLACLARQSLYRLVLPCGLPPCHVGRAVAEWQRRPHALAGDGSDLGELYERAPLADARDVPPVLVSVLLAQEDRHFYQNPSGVDGRGALVAAVQNYVLGRRPIRGASTIAMDAVHCLPGVAERLPASGWPGKMAETGAAMALSRAVPERADMLSIFFGCAQFSRAVGLAEAARVWFSKSPRDLSLSEMALLVGQLPAPSRRDPLLHPEAAEAARLRALRALREYDPSIRNVVEPAELERPYLRLSPARARTEASDFLRALRSTLPVNFSGIQLRTTLDTSLQASAGAALEEVLARLTEGQSGPLLVKTSELRLAFVALDRGGNVRALWDDAPSRAATWPLVTRGGVPQASTMKIHFAAALLDRGAVSLGTALEALPGCRKETADPWIRRVMASSDLSRTVEEALVVSDNAAAICLSRLLGSRDREYLARLGLPAPERGATPEALGIAPVSPLTLTRAFAAVVTGRELPATRYVALPQQTLPGEPVLSPQTAHDMRRVLERVAEQGTARAAGAQLPPGSLLAKTGTDAGSRGIYSLLLLGYYAPSQIFFCASVSAESMQPILEHGTAGRILAPAIGGMLSRLGRMRGGT